MSVTVSSYDNGADTLTLASITGIKVGQRLTVVGDAGAGAAADPRERQTVTISSISGSVVSVSEDLSLNATATLLDGSTVALSYTAYPGVGYWGTMLDTGQFSTEGELSSVDMGLKSGDRWWISFDAADYAKAPGDRTGLDSPESKPTLIADSARWGLTNRQRLERIIAWTPIGDGSALTEVSLNYTDSGGN